MSFSSFVASKSVHLERGALVSWLLVFVLMLYKKMIKHIDRPLLLAAPLAALILGNCAAALRRRRQANKTE